MYRGTALVVAASGALALAALGPVARLLVPGHGAASQLQLPPFPSSLDGLPVATPRTTVAMAQAATVEGLFGFLLAAAVATAAVALVTLLLLWFARASAREGEVAVRRAVGASRTVLVAASLLEGLAVYLLAAGGGAPAALGLGRLAAHDWPGTVLPAHPQVLAAIAAGLGVALLLGAEFPACFTTRRRVVEVEATPVAFFFPALLQLGTCLIALTTSVILLRHLGGAERPGQVAGTLYPASFTMADSTTRSAQYASLLNAAPGVSVAGAGTHLGLGPVARITTDCGQCYRGGIYARFLRPLAVHYFVSPDTFRLLGVRLVAGRLLDTGDTRTAAPVAVVSQSLANGWFENGAPLGRGIQLGDDRTRWYTVVGVVSDFTGAGFGAGQLPAEQVWVGVLQDPPTTAEVLVMPGGVKPTGVALGPGEPFQDRLGREAGPGTWFGRWLGVEALLLLGLAVLGLGAFARLWVLSLRPTLGIRRATGARRGQVIGFVLRQALLVGVVGVLVGAWFGPAVWLALPDLLPGLPAWDTTVMLLAGSLLVTVMVLGALAPAVRAAREAPAALVAGAEEA